MVFISEAAHHPHTALSSGFNNLTARLEKGFITLETFSVLVLTGHIGMIASSRTLCTEVKSWHSLS